MKKKTSRKRAPPKPPPTKYKPEYAVAAAALCFVGATEQGLASYFGVGTTTIKNWRAKHPEFEQAMQEREAADNRVIGALYQRALGAPSVEKRYRLTEVVDEDTGEKRVEERLYERIEKPAVPDTTACIFWLKNRRATEWRDRQEVEVVDGAKQVALLNAGRDRIAQLKRDE